MRFKKVSGKLDHQQQHENKEQNYEEHDEDVASKCDDDDDHDEHNKYTDHKNQGKSAPDNDDVDQCYEDIYIDYNFVAELLSFIYEVE